MNPRLWLSLHRLTRRKAVAPRRGHASRPVDVARRAEEARRRRQEAFGSPPLSEWEQEAMYGAVEAERAKG